MIHQTAIVSSKSHISQNVNIGPYCIVEDNVEIGEDSELISNVHVFGRTQIGKKNKFFPFSVIGSIPQDLKYSGEASQLVIGDNNIFREGVTVNPGTKGGGMLTKIENNCLFMVGSHIAHDCQISSNVVMSNNATLAGHVNINEHVVVGGLSGIHQFVSIGKYAMIGGMSGVGLNIVPYGLYTGIRGKLRGLNIIGLKRKGIEKKVIQKIQYNFNSIFNQTKPILKNIENLTEEAKSIKEINEITDFIKKNIKRGICIP